MESVSERIVSGVLAELEDRSGFDHWWDSLDEDIQAEITQELIDIVDARLRD